MSKNTESNKTLLQSVTFRIPVAMTDWLDAKVAEVNAQGLVGSRSDIIRRIILDAMLKQEVDR